MIHYKNIIIVFLSISILLGLQSCWYYSFRGGSLSSDIKTVSIATFTNQASQVIPSLAENITEKLKDKFVKEMKLTLVDFDGDIDTYQ